jgi:hypothetical protein
LECFTEQALSQAKAIGLRSIEKIDTQFERFLNRYFSCVPLLTLYTAPVATELSGPVVDL